MAEPKNVGERSGLDYLYKARKIGSQEAPAPPSPSQATSDFDASLRAYAYMRVLDAVRSLTRDAASVRLSEVGSRVEMGPAALVPISQRLHEVGLLEIVEPRWADDSVALTDRGRTVVDEGRDQDLVDLLG